MSDNINVAFSYTSYYHIRQSKSLDVAVSIIKINKTVA
jgi:hypothetical protein